VVVFVPTVVRALVTDVRRKLLVIPAATPGSIVGYEVVQDLQPYEMSDDWDFQDTIPVRESRYSVALPQGWTLEYHGRPAPKK